MRILITIIVVCLTGVALAQVPSGITHAPWHYGQTGVTPPPPPTGQCPNQLVLDYSNSCALMAQAWGQ